MPSAVGRRDGCLDSERGQPMGSRRRWHDDALQPSVSQCLLLGVGRPQATVLPVHFHTFATDAETRLEERNRPASSSPHSHRPRRQLRQPLSPSDRSYYIKSYHQPSQARGASFLSSLFKRNALFWPCEFFQPPFPCPLLHPIFIPSGLVQDSRLAGSD